MPTQTVSNVAGISAPQEAAADAMSAAGRAGYAEANEQRNMAQRGSAEVIASAQLQPGEIQSINQILADKQTALDATKTSIGQQQAQVDAMDPQVKAAGQNLYQLLSGQASSMLAPIQAQVDLQRKQMMNNLSSQMGPGFMTSTAGLQAMTNFDIQSSSLMAQTQFQALNQAVNSYGSLAGMQQQGQNAITGQTGSAYQLAQNANQMALQGYEYGANRVTQATEFGQQMQQGAQQNMISTAGGQYAGAAYLGGARSQLSASMLGTMIAGGGMSFMGMGGGKNNIGQNGQQPGVSNNGGGGGSKGNPWWQSWGNNGGGNPGGGGSGASANDMGGVGGAPTSEGGKMSGAAM